MKARKKAVSLADLVEKDIMNKRWVINLMAEPGLIDQIKANARASNLPIHRYVRYVLAEAAANKRRFVVTSAGSQHGYHHLSRK